MSDNKKVKKAGIGDFFRSTVSELKKVVYPTSKQLVNNTIIVLVTCAILASFIYVLDVAFSAGSGAILGKKVENALPEEDLNAPAEGITIDENGNLVDANGNILGNINDMGDE